MKRIVLVACALLFAAACTEKTVKSTSIALKVTLSDPFKLDFIDKVDILVSSADPTRPFAPPTATPTQTSLDGVAFEVESSDFADAGVNEVRMRITGNPFQRPDSTQPAVFKTLFQSKSAG